MLVCDRRTNKNWKLLEIEQLCRLLWAQLNRIPGVAGGTFGRRNRESRKKRQTVMTIPGTTRAKWFE